MADDDLAFLNLVLLIGTMASQRLDSAGDGAPESRNEHLHRCRENIDMLVALKKRTNGRLAPEEEKVLETLLRDLQGRYVKALMSAPPSANPVPPSKPGGAKA